MDNAHCSIHNVFHDCTATVRHLLFSHLSSPLFLSHLWVLSLPSVKFPWLCALLSFSWPCTPTPPLPTRGRDRAPGSPGTRAGLARHPSGRARPGRDLHGLKITFVIFQNAESQSTAPPGHRHAASQAVEQTAQVLNGFTSFMLRTLELTMELDKWKYLLVYLSNWFSWSPCSSFTGYYS